MTRPTLSPQSFFCTSLLSGMWTLTGRKPMDLPCKQPGLDQREHLIGRPGILRRPRLRPGGIDRLGLDADALAVADALAPQRFADRRQIVRMAERDDGIALELRSRSCPLATTTSRVRSGLSVLIQLTSLRSPGLISVGRLGRDEMAILVLRRARQRFEQRIERLGGAVGHGETERPLDRAVVGREIA